MLYCARNPSPFFPMTHAHGADEAQDDPGVYRTLLESTKAIPWRID